MDMYEKMDVVNPGGYHRCEPFQLQKKFKEQIRITKEVMHSRKLSSDLHQLVKGVMIESYIEEGNQKVGAGCYGKSITDPCLGWDPYRTSYLRYRRNEFLSHKLYTHFFTKHKPQEYISCGLHYFGYSKFFRVFTF